MNTATLAQQRFMVSPDGKLADWVDLTDIASRAHGWSDCTDMTDAELQEFMVRRMHRAEP